MDDFNYVCSFFERFGGDSPGLKIEESLCVEFSNFISHMEFWDLPLLGRSFTWFQPKRRISSRLDRILISDGWWDL